MQIDRFLIGNEPKMNRQLTLAKVGHFLRQRKPELALFLLGVLLRMTMAWRYKVGWSYDSDEHWRVVLWIAEHARVPPVETMLETFHPPLYYGVAAGLLKFGVSHTNMVWLSIVCGIIRLGLIWAGLELYLPRSRIARLSALALAAVLAASVHVDGMIYPEPMSGMWVMAAMLLIPLAFRRPPRTRWRIALWVGLILGIAMLTKISGFVIILSIGVAALAEFAFSGRHWKTRAWDLLAWAGMLAVCLAVCGWYFGRNVRDYGTPFVTSFDLPSQHWLVVEKQKIPYLDRRPLGYVFGWNLAIYDLPYFPNTISGHPRFLPTAVASTFVDFWNFSFSGIDPSTKSPIWVGSRPISTQILAVSQYSILGGTLIFVVTALTWLILTPRICRQGDWGLFALLLAPAFMLLLAVHFAIQNPVDDYGVVKGVYMQFAAPPLCGLFGIAVAWSQRKPIRWPVFAALLAALWLVAAYTLYCRLRLPILPLS